MFRAATQVKEPSWDEKILGFMKNTEDEITDMDVLGEELSQGLDMHISTVDSVRRAFSEAAQGQDYLDEQQFKEATLKILNAQESEVPRYRLQGFFQEALACSFSPGSPKGEKTSYTTTPTDRKVTVDKFMVWYRKNFYEGDIYDPGNRSAAVVFYQKKMGRAMTRIATWTHGK
jgi:hypothetical protein